MYEAKTTGGAGHHLRDTARPMAADHRIDLTKDLRQALAVGHLSLHYQPIVRLPGGEVGGVEALLRWRDPARGWVPTADIVRVAEQSGLIHEIGAWVLEQACRDRARWLRLHPSCPLDIAVNVSGRQLRRADFVQTVLSVLVRTGTDPAVLVLEMTEGVLIEDSDRVVEVFAQLRQLGVRLALDDFGTGYSSLSYLRRLPVDVVKIDRTFIADIGGDGAAAAVVAAVVQLAHVLDLSVTGEGVETVQQQRRLGDMGCEAAQGFAFSRPLPADGISDLLAGAGGLVLRLPDDRAPADGSTAAPRGLSALTPRPSRSPC
jgi:EAL domain-containing protein (putative c-di-GMP-specific phosphodiesterase class I)